MQTVFPQFVAQLPGMFLQSRLSRGLGAAARAVAVTAMAFLLGAVGSGALAETQSNPARAIRADQGAPTVTITGPTDIQPRAFWVTITFSEAVTGFLQGDVTVGNGSVVTFSGSGANYRAKIRTTVGGTVTVDVGANVATNAAEQGNVSASRFSAETDIERPTVSITGPSSVRTGPFDVTITFSESVTDFEKGDVTVSNGTVTAFSGSGAGYSATIDPGSSGTVTVDVAGHVATDIVRNANLPASQYSVQANLNAAPVITAPGNKTYEQGEAITAFGISASDSDGDAVTVTVTGLPSGLSYASGQVQGTVSASATAQDYTATISADDGVNTAVTATFTITVTTAASTPPANSAPVITAPGNKTYEQGEAITAFGITTTDADDDEVTVTISGLPSGLSYASGQVQGTVSASATAQAYTVTISADDGVNTAVTATFTITVTQTVRPTVSITGPLGGSPDKAMKMRFLFSQSVTGFELGDLTVSNGSAKEFSGSGTEYWAYIWPNSTGRVTIDVAGHAATDAEGNGNIASQFTRVVDLDRPQATFKGPALVDGNSQVEVSLTWSEQVVGFHANRIVVGGDGRLDILKALNTERTRFTAKVRPWSDGTLTLDIPSGVCMDSRGNGNDAASFSMQVDMVDPTVSIAGPTDTQNGPFDATVTFSEAVTGFQQGEVAVGNGTVTAFSGSGASYTATIAPAATGAVTVDVTAGVAVDRVSRSNTAASQYSVQANLNAPVITAPGNKTYEQGEAITAFGITTTDADDDEVTVTISGLPSGLSYASGQVQGTVSASATAQAYTVTISADDGVNTAVTATFTITVTTAASTPPANSAPVITAPGNKTYEQGEAITAFGITTTDADDDEVTATISGLPSGLSYASGQVQGTVSASATAQDYTVTVSAADGVNTAVTATFTITVTSNSRPTVTISGPTTVQTGAFTVSIRFSESVTGFDKADVTVGNGRVIAFAGSGASNSVFITPAAGGTVTVDVAANVATDADGNGNRAASRYSVQANLSAPVITIPYDYTDGPYSPEGFYCIQDRTIEPYAISVSDADGDDVTVTVTGLPPGLSYSDGAVRGTPMENESLIPAYVGEEFTATIKADDGVHPAVTRTIDISVRWGQARITAPGNKTYEQGEAITAFDITVEIDEDQGTVEVTGLPSGLSYANGQVQGTVSESAEAKAYTVTITADHDGANGWVPKTATFTITVTGPANRPPVIADDSFAAYCIQDQAIWPFSIDVSDPDGDAVTVTAENLPPGLSYSDGKVRGTPMANEPMIQVGTDRLYKVTVKADDGVNPVVTRVFDYSVLYGRPRITVPGNKTYQQGEDIEAFAITVDADERYKTVDVTGLPSDLSYASGQVTGTVSEAAEAEAYTVTITADGDGPEGFTPTTATFTVTVTEPVDGPTVTITGPQDLQKVSFWVTIAFSEAVTGFEQEDMTVGNGSVVAFSGSGASYRAKIRAETSGTVTVGIAANAATNEAGNGNAAASEFLVESDRDRPTLTISGPLGGSPDKAMEVQFLFSEPVTGFELGDITVSNGSAKEFSGSGSEYRAYVWPNSTGRVTIDVAGQAAADAAGNGNIASQLSRIVDLDRPQATFKGPAVVDGNSQVEVSITWSEPVAGFSAYRIKLGGPGRLDILKDLNGKRTRFTAKIRPWRHGTITLEIPKGVCLDKSGNGNDAASFSMQVDMNPPTVSIAGPTDTQEEPFDVSFTFSEDVTGFEQVDVTVGNGTVTAFSGSGAGYTATVTPTSSGTVTVDVPAGVARDSAGHDNDAASQFSVLADLIRPTVTIAGPATAQNSDFDVTITFSESVTGFTQGDVNVGNGAVTTFSGSGANYTATIAPTASGTVTVDVPANMAMDADNDGNTAASQYSVDADLDAPTVTISGPADKQTRPFAVNITFSEPVTGFEQGDVTVGNGALTTFSGSGATYTATVAPKVTGTVTVDVASAVAIDVAGNGNGSASRYSVEADLTKRSVTLSGPAVTLSGPTETQNGPFDVSITFLKKAPGIALLPEPVSVTGFEKDDVTVANGSITAFSGSGAQYTATISPTAIGIVTAEVPANMAVDAANNGNDASNRISVLVPFDG